MTTKIWKIYSVIIFEVHFTPLSMYALRFSFPTRAKEEVYTER